MPSPPRRSWARAPAAGALAALTLASAGCSSGTDAIPSACMEGTTAFLQALAAAPRAVTVDGARISQCFARRSNMAAIEAVGSTLIAAADELAPAARAGPGSRAATELGYLIGASERGAARTEGIHYELVRRLQMDLVGVDTRAPAYTTGHSAGRRYG